MVRTDNKRIKITTVKVNKTMVDIIIAGVQKCGTTALHGYLCRHPQIVGGYKKELHFFDDPMVDWHRPDYAAYEAMFPPREVGKKWLDASPSYFYLPQCLSRLRAYNSEVRLILLFRDPIERAWSHWAMSTQYGRETLDFDAAIRAECSRITASHPGDISYKVYAYVDRGFYGRQLARALKIFSRDQILCLASENLLKEPEATLARISTHLGITAFEKICPLELNKSPNWQVIIKPETINFIQEKLFDDILLFSQLSGIDTRNWSLLQNLLPAT